MKIGDQVKVLVGVMKGKRAKVTDVVTDRLGVSWYEVEVIGEGRAPFAPRYRAFELSPAVSDEALVA